MKKAIRLTESDLHKIIKESVNSILTELDWKTYMNAARKRKEQGEVDRASDLETYAQDVFAKKHGKGGLDYNYEGDSPSFKGRYTKGRHGQAMNDSDFDVKNPTINHGNWEERKYRFGKGIPYMNHGELRDDTYDYRNSLDPNDVWDGETMRHHTMKYDKDGEKYDSYLSSVGNEVSVSQDDDYNARQDAMANDMRDYYAGKSKYTKGKGW